MMGDDSIHRRPTPPAAPLELRPTSTTPLVTSAFSARPRGRGEGDDDDDCRDPAEVEFVVSAADDGSSPLRHHGGSPSSSPPRGPLVGRGVVGSKRDSLNLDRPLLPFGGGGDDGVAHPEDDAASCCHSTSVSSTPGGADDDGVPEGDGGSSWKQPIAGKENRKKSSLRIHNSSILSNAFFFLGSVFYLIVDARDVYWELVDWDYDDDDAAYDDDEDDDDYDDDDTIFVVGGRSRQFDVTVYMILYVLASLMFLLNAIVDYTYARRMERKCLTDVDAETDVESDHPYSVLVKTTEQTPPSGPDDAWTCEGGAEVLGPSTADEDDSCSSSSSSSSSSWWSSSSTLLPKLLTVEKRVALLLGTGAALDLIAAVTVETGDEPHVFSLTFSLLACHFYLAEALVSVLGRKALASSPDDGGDAGFRGPWRCLCCPALWSLGGMGDALFLVGSAIDVATSYCYFDPDVAYTFQLSLWGLLSSTLWVVDSLLYIALMVREG